MADPINVNHENKASEKFLMIFTIISVLVGSFVVIFQNSDNDKNNNANNVNVVIPNNNVPINTNSQPNNLQNVDISGEYTITSNPYSNYDTNAFQVAVNGKLSDLQIIVSGTITDSKEKFVSFNIGQESGVLNGVRKDENSLDYNQTKARGGVFTKDVNFEVDTFAPTVLATSKEEFLAQHQVSKSVLFWDSIKPTPSVFKMLVAPYNADGSYTGVTINSIKASYQCSNGLDSCKVVACEKGELFTKCLKDNFGFSAAKNWCDRTQVQGCENLKQ